MSHLHQRCTILTCVKVRSVSGHVAQTRSALFYSMELHAAFVMHVKGARQNRTCDIDLSDNLCGTKFLNSFDVMMSLLEYCYWPACT